MDLIEAARMARKRLETFADDANAGRVHYSPRELKRKIWAAFAEPFTRLRPALYPDGDQWCALYGENLQEGVAGFGPSPAEAEQAFNKAWGERLPPRKE